jgi:hypothetical protein
VAAEFANARPTKGIAMKLMTALPVLASAGVMFFVFQAFTSVAPRFSERFQFVQAPTLTDRTLGEAEDAARTQGLQITVASSQPTDDAPKDVVVAQTPRPGSRMRRGDVVKLTLSAGLRPPSVTGKSLDEARAALIRAGWIVAPEVETRPGNGSAPGVVMEQRPRADEVAPQKGSVSLVIAERNLAFGRGVQKSTGGSAPEATDGQEGSVAWLPGNLPQWIEVNFGAPATITEVSLLAAIEKPGSATVELWAWDANGRFFPVQLFNQEVSDNAALTARLAQPASNVVRLRVVTTAATAPLGWREIGVSDR